MRNYRSDASSTVRFEYGVALARGLSHFEETQPLAEPFSALNGELFDQQEVRARLRRPLLEARQDLRFANYTVDAAIRSFHRTCEIADGGRRGPITTAAFPDGVSTVVAPAGAKQVKPLKDLIDRVTTSRAGGVAALRDAELPKLHAAITTLETSVAAYEAARRAYYEAFTTELAIRDDHRLAVDRLMGQVRATFPGDRERQDVIFPDVDVAKGRGEGGDTDPPPPDGPTG
jgi:hypothetical protein